MASWHETHKNQNKIAAYLALGAVVVGGVIGLSELQTKPPREVPRSVPIEKAQEAQDSLDPKNNP